jgi:hypothetical protein
MNGEPLNPDQNKGFTRDFGREVPSFAKRLFQFSSTRNPCPRATRRFPKSSE